MQTNITYFLQKATLGPTHREIDENAPKAQIKPEETQRAANRALGHAQHSPLQHLRAILCNLQAESLTMKLEVLLSTLAFLTLHS